MSGRGLNVVHRGFNQIIRRYGGFCAGTMCLLEELLTAPGVTQLSEADLVRRLKRKTTQDHRTAAQAREGLAALFDEGFIRAKPNVHESSIRMIRWKR